MRSFCCAFALIFCLVSSTPTAAGPVLSMTFIDGLLYLDGANPAHQDGWEVNPRNILGPWHLYEATYEADTGPLQSYDGQRLYTYVGGTFAGELALRNLNTGEEVVGNFVMPIKSLQLDIAPDTGGTGEYTLGRGWLAPELAEALGIRRRIAGGTGNTFLFDWDESNLPIVIEDALFLDIEVVPEPSLIVLTLSGLSAAATRRRWLRCAPAMNDKESS